MLCVMSLLRRSNYGPSELATVSFRCWHEPRCQEIDIRISREWVSETLRQCLSLLCSFCVVVS